MVNFIANWRREREAVRELSRLSDRELADLGIARADIKTIAAGALVTNRDEMETPAPASSEFDTMAPAWAVQNRRALAA